MGHRESHILDRRTDAKTPGASAKDEVKDARDTPRRSLYFPLVRPRSSRGTNVVGDGIGSTVANGNGIDKAETEARTKSVDANAQRASDQTLADSVPESAHASEPVKEAEKPAPARLRVAIIGGGIGGLALALFLAAKRSDSAYPNDLDVAIYEAAPSLTELGAGVGVWLRTWRILSSVRFADGEALARDLAAIAPQGRDMSEGLRKAFEFRKGDGGPEGLSFYTMRVPFGVLTLHRADFQQAIARHAVPPATAHFGKRLVGYTYADESDLSSELILQFADGSTARADVLIGADGIRSAVRREMVRRLATRGELGEVLADPNASTDLSTPAQSGARAESIRDGDASKPGAEETAPAHPPGRQKDSDAVLDPVSDLVEPVWSGTVVYRYLIPRAALEARFPGHRAGQGPVVYFGKDKHVLAFPIVHSGPGVFAAGETTPTPMVNLVAFVSEPEREGTRISGTWVRPAPAVDLLAAFEGWEDEVRALLELTEEPLLWAIHTVKPLPRYSDSNGRVVLLGDAAHAMTPHQGAGGGQAIEDAQVLAALLAHPRTTRETMPAVLRAYDAVRVPVAREVVRTSRLNGMMYEFNHGWDEVSDAEATTPGSVNPEGEEFRRLRRHAEAIMAIHDWEWTDAPAESQPAQAVRLFQEMLVEAAAKTDTEANAATEVKSENVSV